MTIPTIDQLKRGVAIAEEIASLENELAGILGNHAAAPAPVAKSVPAPVKAGRRKLSPQALANIRAAQKKRWAKVNAGTKVTAKVNAPAKAKTPVPVKKRTMSPAAKAKLAAAMKKRWALAKAGKAPAPTAKKK